MTVSGKKGIVGYGKKRGFDERENREGENREDENRAGNRKSYLRTYRNNVDVEIHCGKAGMMDMGRKFDVSERLPDLWIGCTVCCKSIAHGY